MAGSSTTSSLSRMKTLNRRKQRKQRKGNDSYSLRCLCFLLFKLPAFLVAFASPVPVSAGAIAAMQNPTCLMLASTVLMLAGTVAAQSPPGVVIDFSPAKDTQYIG